MASALRAAIVLPDKYQGRRWIGHTAAAEARAFLEAGKPVLVYAEGRLTAWPDCRRLAGRPRLAPKFTPLEILIPAGPPRPLPTLDASLRALGRARDEAQMTRDEWRALAESVPATPNQVGAIRREFRRLGFGPADRAERLRITGQLAQADGQLATTKDLTMGQAGRVVGALTGCRSLPDLHAATDPGRTARQRARMRARLIRMLAGLTSPNGNA